MKKKKKNTNSNKKECLLCINKFLFSLILDSYAHKHTHTHTYENYFVFGVGKNKVSLNIVYSADKQTDRQTADKCGSVGSGRLQSA
jgi:hypothetical protein